jgi:hypothetical protein
MTEAPDKVTTQGDEFEKAEGADRIVRADLKLVTGERVLLIVPHTFTPDQFESVVVTLLQMRVASEARTEAEAPIVVPKGPKLVAADGRPLS